MGQTENWGRLKWKPDAPSYKRTCVDSFFLFRQFHRRFYSSYFFSLGASFVACFVGDPNSPSKAIHGASLCIRIEMVAFSILPSQRRHNNRLSLVIFFFATRTKSIPFNWPNNRNEWRIDEEEETKLWKKQRMNSIYGSESCMWQPETAFLRRKPARART